MKNNARVEEHANIPLADRLFVAAQRSNELHRNLSLSVLINEVRRMETALNEIAGDAWETERTRIGREQYW